MARARQRGLDVRTWGGKRKGAGRKPAGARAGVPHQRRPALSPHHPAHVTMRVLPDVWNLRSRRAFRAIGRAFVSSKERDGFRLIHFSVQGNQLHLIVEARDAQRLSRGMQGLATWIALAQARAYVQAAKLDPYSSAGGDGPGLTAAPSTRLLRRGRRRRH
jgi:REP element-mobilizing transposase RayT